MDKVKVDGKGLIPNGDDCEPLGPPREIVVPPLNFSPVETNIYRSGVPLPFNHSFLRQLRLRTVLWLALEDPPDSLVKFCEDEGVELKGFASSTDEMIPQKTIIEGIQLLLNGANHPILVCCGMGGHRTGALIGCFRKLQGWNLASVSEEYRRFTNNRGASRLLVELIVEQFDVRLIEFA